MPNLVFSLFADTANFNKGMSRAKKSIGSLELSTKKASQAIQGAIAAMGSAVTIGGLVRLSDNITNINTKLANVTSNARLFDRAYKGLFQVAQTTGQEFGAVVDNFVKLNVSLKESTKEAYDLNKVVELLSRGFAAAGTDARTVAGTTLQLTQGLATDFQAAGQELNSLIEGAPVLAYAIAKELGGKAAVDLKKFAEEGRLTQESFLDALLQAEDTIKAFEIPATIQRSLVRVKNEFLLLLSNTPSFRSAMEGVANAIDSVAKNMDTVAKLAVIATGALGGFVLAANATKIAAFGASIGNTVLAFSQLALTVRSASQAMMLFNATFMLSPPMIIAGIVAVIGGFVLFRKEIIEATRDIKIFGVSVGDTLEKIPEYFTDSFAGYANLLQGYIDKIKIAIFELDRELDKITGTSTPLLGLFDNSKMELYNAYKRVGKTAGENFREGFNASLKKRDGDLPSFEDSKYSRGSVKNLLGSFEGVGFGLPDNESKAIKDAIKMKNAPKIIASAQKELEDLIKSTRTESEKLTAEFEKLKKLKAFADTPEELEAINRAIMANRDAFAELTRETEEFSIKGKSAIQDFATSSIRSFDDLRNFALQVLEDIALSMVNIGFDGKNKGGLEGTIGGSIGGAIANRLFSKNGVYLNARNLANQGGLSLPKFSTGGRINVGGGVDSQLVAFKAMPNERISIEKPGQNLSGGGTYYIDARGADSQGLARLENTIRQINGSIESRAVNAVQTAKQRGMMTA